MNRRGTRMASVQKELLVNSPRYHREAEKDGNGSRTALELEIWLYFNDFWKGSVRRMMKAEVRFQGINNGLRVETKHHKYSLFRKKLNGKNKSKEGNMIVTWKDSRNELRIFGIPVFLDRIKGGREIVL